VRANPFAGARDCRQEGALQFPSVYAAKLELRGQALFALLRLESSDGCGGPSGLHSAAVEGAQLQPRRTSPIVIPGEVGQLSYGKSKSSRRDFSNHQSNEGAPF